MAAGRLREVLSWTVIVPVLAIVLLAFTWGHKLPVIGGIDLNTEPVVEPVDSP